MNRHERRKQKKESGNASILKQELLKNGSLGELIINSEDNYLRPFDIITSVNGQLEPEEAIEMMKETLEPQIE